MLDTLLIKAIKNVDDVSGVVKDTVTSSAINTAKKSVQRDRRSIELPASKRGNKALRRFEAQKRKEARQAQQEPYAGLSRSEIGQAKDRQGQISERLEKAAEGPLQPELAFSKKSRSIRDLEQRPYGEKKLDTIKAPTDIERTINQPEAHHILELEFMDNIYRNASPRAKKKLDSKLASYLPDFQLKGGNTKSNYIVLSKLMHNSSAPGQLGIHQFLDRRGIQLSRYKLPDNASDDQRLEMLGKLLEDLSTSGYFDELINRKFAPGKFSTDETGKANTPQGLNFYSMVP